MRHAVREPSNDRVSRIIPCAARTDAHAHAELTRHAPLRRAGRTLAGDGPRPCPEAVNQIDCAELERRLLPTLLIAVDTDLITPPSSMKKSAALDRAATPAVITDT